MEILKENKNLWKGPQIPYPYPSDFMFGDLIMKTFSETDPKRILQICADDDTELTCEELKLSSIRVAQNFIKIGLKPNDVIGLVTHQSHLATKLIFGSILSGTLLNPIDESFDEKDIRAVFSNTKPKIIICNENAISKIKSALNDVDFEFKIYSTSKDSSYQSAFKFLSPTNDEENFELLKFDESSHEKVVAILCTSGTTGSPKGLKMSHAQFINFGVVISIRSNGEKRKTFSTSPLYWATGFLQNIYPLFTGEFRTFTKESFSVKRVTEIVEKYKVSHFTLAPSALAALLNSNEFLASKNSCKTFIAIGSIVYQSLRKKFEETFPDRELMISYGMTEIVMSTTRPGDYKVENSVGSIIFPNTMIKIVDDEGKSLGEGETGEICGKSSLKFLGYYNNPEASRDALDEENFIKTGDLGYFNKDGHLCVVDRKKNILKYKGFHFNSSEIEDAIQSIEGVESVSVVGLPDIYLTNATAAAIVKAEGSNLTEEEVVEFIANQFPIYKQLHGGIYFFEKLPTTPNGKILKRVIIENILKIRK